MQRVNAGSPKRFSPTRGMRSIRMIRRRSWDSFSICSTLRIVLFGCVSGPDAGAMGLHFLNGSYQDYRFRAPNLLLLHESFE
jgi:hypothetical protein